MMQEVQKLFAIRDCVEVVRQTVLLERPARHLPVFRVIVRD
jgi:hypothetical protein